MSGKKIVIIDHGVGNTHSIANALDFLGCDALLSSCHADIENAKGYILPGVGAFKIAMQNLQEQDIIDILEKNVLSRNKPILGICLGMQLLAKSSVEGGLHKGLGWIDATVQPLQTSANIRVPHVGWNNIKIVQNSKLLKNIQTDSNFYFDHSFHVVCDDKTVETSTIFYGENITASVQKANIFATQFHPEKSQTAGLKLLRNFLDIVEKSDA